MSCAVCELVVLAGRRDVRMREEHLLYYLEQIDASQYRKHKREIEAAVPGFGTGGYGSLEKKRAAIRRNTEAVEYQGMGLQLSELPAEIADIAVQCLGKCSQHEQPVRLSISESDMLFVDYDPPLEGKHKARVQTTLVGARAPGCPDGQFLPTGTVFRSTGWSQVIQLTRSGMQDIAAVMCINGNPRLMGRAFSPGDREVGHLRVMVTTGGQKHAGNKDARIRLRVLDKLNVLNSTKNDFERGAKNEVFTLAMQRGTMLSSLMGSTAWLENLDYKKKGRGWFCASLEVAFRLRGERTFTGFQTVFPGWLDEKEDSNSKHYGKYSFRLLR